MIHYIDAENYSCAENNENYKAEPKTDCKSEYRVYVSNILEFIACTSDDYPWHYGEDILIRMIDRYKRVSGYYCDYYEVWRYDGDLYIQGVIWEDYGERNSIERIEFGNKCRESFENGLKNGWDELFGGIEVGEEDFGCGKCGEYDGEHGEIGRELDEMKKRMCEELRERKVGK